LPEDQQMTVEEYLAFTETRPDGERWELIEGRPVMNPAPTDWHQQIAGNVFFELESARQKLPAPWVPLIGTGTRVPASPNSLPQPDLMVQEAPVGAEPTSVREDSFVLFEVLSRSNTRANQAWRKKVYASIPKLQHYVTVAQQQVQVVRYDRADEWRGMRLDKLGHALELPGLRPSVSIGLDRIYRLTPLAGRSRRRAGV
jgi:Uma2 family endonuclease